MREIYKLCNRSLRIGEIMVLVVKDYVKGGERVYCSKDNLRVAYDAGFALQADGWHERYTDPKLFQIQARKKRVEKGDIYKPELDIDFEDVMVMEKVSEVA
jgi:hypothetical protein